MSRLQFDTLFHAATGNLPFRWQQRLFEQFVEGLLPHQCDIPTGLGKTSIIPIWLFALAQQLCSNSLAPTLPRRLVYIVDRRVVVDQATEEAESLLQRLQPADGIPPLEVLRPVIEALRGCGCESDNAPFVISTLRGQHADNRMWSRDPSRPAIIIGTVDMIGSRLLFSGYGGLGAYSRSLHAGLLAQDALIVVDEAHLCPAFVATLSELREQLGRKQTVRPFHTLLLSATQPLNHGREKSADPAPHDLFFLKDEDLKDNELKKRLHSKKRLRFFSSIPSDGEKTSDAMAGLPYVKLDAPCYVV